MSDKDVMSREEYSALMTEKVKQQLDGKTVVVPVEFLYDLQMFLLSSSHKEDEGNLPYPSFQWLAHDLSYKIHEYTKDHVESFPCDQSVRYDLLWERYQQENKDDEAEEIA